MGEIGNGYTDFSETDGNEVCETMESCDVQEIDSEFLQELDETYDAYMKEKELPDIEETNVDNAENNIETIKCRNENLAGTAHPETGVPFEKRQVEVDGKQYEVVVPQFESTFDAQLPEDKLKVTDSIQFKECNIQLKEEVANNPKLREKFDEEQLEQIQDEDTPSGYSWHHDAEVGKMQLVNMELHQKTGHTGGRFIWGGGTENR